MAKSEIEKHTEHIVEQEMKIVDYGENDFGGVYVQGELTPNSNINDALKEAGGKPKECKLEDFSTHGNGKAKPEYVITLNHDLSTIIVVECKNSLKKHKTQNFDHPKDFAVDGALYYAKYLKKYFNVIAIGVSGTKTKELNVNAYYWIKNQDSFSKELIKSKDIILEPENYLKLVNGEKVQKQYSLEEVKTTAIKMHNSLRTNKMTENLKPLFIAGILIALQDDAFSNDYDKISNFDSLLDNCCSAIKRVLKDGEIESDKIEEIQRKFRDIKSGKIKSVSLSDDNSLRWYINLLEMKIKPMMEYVGNTIDALSVFYHEFISYSSGDKNSLGIVLTPQHLTEFMVELINIDKNSRVLDICCGSGAFLVTAMGSMFKQAVDRNELEYIRKSNLYGIELDPDIHTLALANMIIRKDGKSHIIQGDCFDPKIIKKIQNIKDINGNNTIFNKGLLNPPYSQNDHVELEFLEQELSLINQGGEVAIVCPMSCAIGTKFKDVRRRLMAKHTLKAVFSMPDDIFYGQGTGTCVCVMVWEAGKPHDSKVSTFFGYCKDDGFVKKKKQGRIDAYGKWDKIKQEWLRLYREKEVIDGNSAKACVDAEMEWLCEAYMETDYTKLTVDDFQQTVNDYLAFLVKEGTVYEN